MALLLSIVKQRGLITSLDVEALIISLLLVLQLRKWAPPGAPVSPAKRRRLLQKILLPLATLILAFSFTFEPFSSALESAFERKWLTVMSTNAISTTFKLEMDSAACAKGIGSTLRKETLAETAEADFTKGKVVIWIDPQKTSLATLLQTLKLHGFDATPEK